MTNSEESLLAAKRKIEKEVLIRDPRRFFKVKEAKEPYGPENIVAVGIGPRRRSGSILDEKCIKLFVRKKIPVEKEKILLDPWVRAASIAERFHVRVDVDQIGELVAASHHRAYRPVQGGVSGGHFATDGGTLGCVVQRERDLNRYVLSCNHVIANENAGIKGRDKVLQPAKGDNGTMRDAIGLLYDFEPLRFNGGVNFIDAAIGRIDRSVRTVRRLAGDGVPSGEMAAYDKEDVKKVGRTTEETKGVVMGLNVNTAPIRKYRRGVALFNDQVIVESRWTSADPSLFADEGDSGAIVMDADTRKVVGMITAVGVPDHAAVVSNISYIRKRFGLVL